MSEVMGHAGRWEAARLGRGWRGWGFSLIMLCLLVAGKVRGDGVALNFFTNTADRLIRFSTARWCAQNPVYYANTFGGLTNGFSLTNIPVLINGQFVYTPAVNRLLQLSANLYEATTNTFYPAVYRPSFFVDANSNVFITGYHQIDAPVTAGVTPLDSPTTLAGLPMGYTSSVQTNANVNVYGIPWIIGAKKYRPNFNQFYMENLVQVTRALQVNRLKVEGWNSHSTAPDFSTNQIFIMSITNQIGFSFWNSYLTNYPGGTPSIYARDLLYMFLTNSAGRIYLNPATNIFFQTNFNTWPGAQWNSNFAPNYRTPAPNSFFYSGGNFVVLSPSQYNPDADVFFTIPPGGVVFNTNDTLLPLLPHFGLVTSNWFQAYILDNGNVIDYVEFLGPNNQRSIDSELYDHYPGSNLSPYDMWYTNASGASFNGPPLGVINQINVSQTGTGYPANSWRPGNNVPPTVADTIANEAGYFRSFFAGAPIQINGTILYNTNLQARAPYTPIRTMGQITVWQANDPLVHYLASDLNDVDLFTGTFKTDDPTVTRSVSQNSIGQSYQLEIQDDRYQPWGTANQLMLLPNVDTNRYNLAYRDPLVYGSDNWDFPTNMSGPDWLGRVHRGTPWQTLYLKATNILDYQNLSIPANGFATWTNWMNDAIPVDALNAAPVSDHDLMIPLMALFNTNDVQTLLGVNDPVQADWLAQLDGVDVLTNVIATQTFQFPDTFEDLIVSSNSPAAALIYNAIQTARAAQPGGNFANIGDILQTPQLAEQSPFLDTTDGPELVYGLTDEAYERIPAQLLYRVRADSTGMVTPGSGQMTVQFTGSDLYPYVIQTSCDLVHWTAVSTNYPVNDVIQITVPVGVGRQYYRSVLQP